MTETNLDTLTDAINDQLTLENERKAKQRRDTITGVREVMSFLEDHPNLPLPNIDLQRYGMTKAEMIEATKAFKTATKTFFGNYFELAKEFTGDVSLKYNASRQEVCERIVTGQKTIPAYTEPAREVEETVEDVIEWKCHPLLTED